MKNWKKTKKKPTTSGLFLKSSSAEKAFNSIIRYLSRRDHSTTELKTKLSRFYTPEAIEPAILRAEEYKYIKDDVVLAEQLQNALHRRDKSHRQILAKLANKGLPPVIKNWEEEVRKCQLLLNRRFPNLDVSKDDIRVKAYRYLASRGFDFETIRTAIKATSDHKKEESEENL